MPRLNETRVANWLVSALAFGTLGVCVPRIAQAHFHLDAPPSWATQDTQGNPQKSGPCGETNVPNMTQAVATNMVTAFQPGQTISVTITETVMHPGHYRVALATDRSMLPADPAVTAGATACGSAEIAATPVFPVLVDGALVHTAKFSGAQTIQVTLPTNITCSKCTLQVIEFMSSHGLNDPGGCFYHHCADISIGAGGASGGAGGVTAGGAAGAGGKGGKGGNGGTTQTGGATDGGATNGGAKASGGATATGGAMGAGGSTTTGGVTGNGGTTGGVNSNTGGTTSTGGTAISSGGTTSSTGGSTVAGGANTGGSNSGAPNAGTGGEPANDAGCGCSLPGRNGHPWLAGLAALSALGGLLRRRRRST